jgi:hypothetical protein
MTAIQGRSPARMLVRINRPTVRLPKGVWSISLSPVLSRTDIPVVLIAQLKSLASIRETGRLGWTCERHEAGRRASQTRSLVICFLSVANSGIQLPAGPISFVPEHGLS